MKGISNIDTRASDHVGRRPRPALGTSGHHKVCLRDVDADEGPHRCRDKRGAWSTERRISDLLGGLGLPRRTEGLPDHVAPVANSAHPPQV
jgi:hypothetical protein